MPLTLKTRPPKQNVRVTTDLDQATADHVGTVGVRVLQSIDIAVRHAESFAAMQDAIA